MSNKANFLDDLIDKSRNTKHKESLDNSLTTCRHKRRKSKLTESSRTRFIYPPKRRNDAYLMGEYRNIVNPRNDRELTMFLFNPNDPDLLIREYFLAKPDNRRKLHKHLAKHINSVETILEILEWSTKSHVQEAYDAAIDLLAECSDGNVILKVANQKIINYATNSNNVSATEEKWEVLIKGIACNQNISIKQKFDTITQLIPASKRRLVKTAIIDALSIMQDEVDTNSIKEQLAIFVSSKESDKYIREYAKEAMEEIL